MRLDSRPGTMCVAPSRLGGARAALASVACIRRATRAGDPEGNNQLFDALVRFAVSDDLRARAKEQAARELAAENEARRNVCP